MWIKNFIFATLCLYALLSVARDIKKQIAKYQEKKFKKDFRTLFPNNHIVLRTKVRAFFSRLEIGEKSYGELNISDGFNANTKLKIGNYCSIAHDVWFILGNEHPLTTVSTYPFKVMCFGQKGEALSKGDIIVEDDVWIGMNATICSGVKIGQGAVIGAGALVTKDVPPYAVVGGVPAKVIKYRFSDSIIKKLLSVDIKKLFDSFSESDIDLIYSDLTEENIDQLLSKVN